MNDVVVEPLEFSCIAATLLTKCVQMFQRRGIDGDATSLSVNFIQRATIAHDFLLGSVTRAGIAQNERLQPVAIHSHTFDTIGRFRTLDDGGVAQRLQNLRRLAGVKLLFALGLGNVRQQPCRAGGHRQIAESVITERIHLAKMRESYFKNIAEQPKLRFCLMSLATKSNIWC